MCKNVACSSPRRCHSNGLSFLSLACSCVDFVVTVRIGVILTRAASLTISRYKGIVTHWR